MKNRIKEIRKDKKMSMEKFGELIGLKKNSISQLESGVNSPSDVTIKSICREFSVNEEWLRHGTGDMYIPTADKLENYLGMISKGDDDFIKDIIEVYMELDQTSKEALKQIGLKMADKIKKREQK